MTQSGKGFSLQSTGKSVLILYDMKEQLWRQPILIEEKCVDILDIISQKSASSNYAFSGFEGEKARRNPKRTNEILMPTLEKNHARLNNLVKFYDIKKVPFDFYKEAHRLLIGDNQKHIPNDGNEFYIRPLFSIGNQLGIKALQAGYAGIILFGSPAGPYFDHDGPITVSVITDQLRCLPGDAGDLKASAHYFKSFKGSKGIKDSPEDDRLFLSEELLDSEKAGKNGNIYKDTLEEILKCGIQEMPVANVCCIKDDVLYSPMERDTILPSTTKRHVFKIARDLCLTPVMDIRPVTLQEFIDADEAFTCGTALSVTPIKGVYVLGEYFQIGDGKEGKTTAEIKGHLMDIYWGRKDPYNWMTKFYV